MKIKLLISRAGTGFAQSVGDVVELEFTSNGEWRIDHHNDDERVCCARVNFGDIQVRVICKGGKDVNGMYPYTMPIVNGKAQRTRGKTITVEVIKVKEIELLLNNTLWQEVYVA
jgi:hypothetical protein